MVLLCEATYIVTGGNDGLFGVEYCLPVVQRGELSLVDRQSPAITAAGDLCMSVLGIRLIGGMYYMLSFCSHVRVFPSSLSRHFR